MRGVRAANVTKKIFGEGKQFFIPGVEIPGNSVAPGFNPGIHECASVSSRS